MSAMLDFGSRDEKSVVQIIVIATLYLFLIFTAQSWIATFNSYYQTYILKRHNRFIFIKRDSNNLSYSCDLFSKTTASTFQFNLQVVQLVN
jgi:hypothetical protein